MPAPLQPSPTPCSRRCASIGACLVALALGCPAPKVEPTTSPDEAPSSPPPAEAAAPKSAPTPLGPLVLFTVSDGVLAPIICHDGQSLIDGDAGDCMGLAPAGDLAVLDTGERVTLAATTEAPCAGSTTGTFEGRAVEGELGFARFAVWPLTASDVLTLQEGTLEPTADELAAMVALLKKETEGLYEVEPKLGTTTGLHVDLDGDGAPDRVFAAHEEGRLYGVVAVFPARDPKAPVLLSALQYDAPRLIGTTEVDGRPGREVLVDALFVEGIENTTIVSAYSNRVLGLHDGAAAWIGSWGCRMF